MKPSVRAEIDRSEKALRAALLLSEEGLLEDAISRSYYAVLHAAKAALLVHDTVAESHAAVRRLFGKMLIQAGHIEREWAAVIANEQDQRQMADYDVEATWEIETVRKLIEDAQAFVRRIQDYIEGRESSAENIKK
jgi:hypothetical protein